MAANKRSGCSSLSIRHILTSYPLIMTSSNLVYVIVAISFPFGSSVPVKGTGSSSTTTTTGFRMSDQELARLGITHEDALEQIRLLLRGNCRCKSQHGHPPGAPGAPGSLRVPGSLGTPGVKRPPIINDDDMLRYFIRNRTVTCNDGSRPGFYIRKSQHGSTRWLIFLEGGWFCFDNRSCQGRWMNSPHLMSSNHWPVSRKGSGILSWNSDENPFIHNGNLVYVPYCSSDAWSGTSRSNQKGDFAFMGALILDEVIKELYHLHGLATATKVYLAGSSAGGTGVLLSLDRVSQVVSSLAPGVEVRGIADSGWFLDNRQFREVPCTDSHSCSPSESVQRGIQLWHGLVPESCRLQFPVEQWKCYFGFHLYSSLKTVVFVVQHLFDEAQLTADNVGPPVSRKQWEYIRGVGQDIKRTLTNVSALFAPACLSHVILTRSDWKQSNIDGVSLPEALACWESGKLEFNRYSSTQFPKRHLGGLRTQNYGKTLESILSDQPFKTKSKRKSSIQKTIEQNKLELRKKTKKMKQQNKKEKKKKKKTMNQRGNKSQRTRNQSVALTVPNISINRFSRQKRSTAFFDAHHAHHIRHHDNRCSHRRLDDCSWPQCNASCPRLRNPFTGEDMGYVDLLLQFGLDLSAVAEMIGTDLSTIENMNHGQLLHILIQSSR